MADLRPATQTLRPNSIGLAAIVFLIIATVAPMSGTIGALPLAFGLGTGSGTAAAFAVVAVVLVLFTVGYMAMSRHIANAGGFYVYIGKGLGMRMGRAAGYVAFLSYNVFQVAIWGTFGFFCNIFTAEYFGFELPWIVWVLAGIAIMGTLGYFDIDVSAKVLGVAVVLEVAIILAMDFAILFQGGASGINLAPFSPGEFLSSNTAIGLMFAFLLFIGFEATAIYAEEAREPRKTIPRAAITAVLIIAGFYMLTSWSLAMAWGVEEAAGVALEDPGNFIFGAAAIYLGEWSVAVMLVLFIVSTFATNLGFHNAIARYQFSLARDGWAPRVLERIHPKHRSPFMGSIVQTIIAAVMVLAFFVAGAHPYEQMFTWLISLGALGLIALMAFTSLAVIAYFRRTRRERSVWVTVIAPAIAAVALAAEAVLLVANWGLQTMDAGGLVPYLPLLLLAAAAIGFAWKHGAAPAWAADERGDAAEAPEATEAVR
ncbi:APC family permease [Ruicaihuangia caeni]|uniref:APC family permease n=1 Tax=Ruicaihuangia caeni TaxID=3042517 RepID=UPI00338FE288